MDELVSYLESMGFKPSAGTEYVGRCPHCGRAGHLYVNVADGETWDGKKKPAGRWVCFGCDTKSMDFARLLAEMDSIPFGEARSTVAKWRLGGVKFHRPIDQVIALPDGQWLPAEYEPVSQCWPKYLDRRDITKATAASFKLGVCRTGPLAHRIILPIECPGGKSYQARAISPDMEPRYLSGDGSGQLLFGWHTIESSDMAIIVEGPFDALKVAQAGLPVVALMGKQLRDPQAGMLASRKRRYIVMLDPLSDDPVAVDNACVIAERLNGQVVIDLPSDPGDATTAQILHAVNNTHGPQKVRDMVRDHRLGSIATWR